jgi:hypothetical protein
MASTPVAQQWRELPGNVRSAAAGLVAGAAFGLLTKNVIAAICIAVLLAVIAFVWPSVHSHGWLGIIAVLGCLVIAFGTADIYGVNGYPEGNGQYKSYSDSPYLCGSVVGHPFTNPTSDWVAVENVQTSNGYDRPGSTSFIDGCRSDLNRYRVITAVSLVLMVLALIGLAFSESRWRKREAIST